MNRLFQFMLTKFRALHIDKQQFLVLSIDQILNVKSNCVFMADWTTYSELSIKGRETLWDFDFLSTVQTQFVLANELKNGTCLSFAIQTQRSHIINAEAITILKATDNNHCFDLNIQQLLITVIKIALITKTSTSRKGTLNLICFALPFPASLIMDFVRNMQLVIKLMYKQSTKEQIINKSKDFYRNLVKQARPQPFALNISLTSNPFLKDRDAFKFLKFQLAEFNKRIDKGEVKDTYEILSFQKLHSMLSDLAQIDTRQDQITALQQLSVWQREQQRLIQQRYDQGVIRYTMNKEYRDVMKVINEKKVDEEQEELQIPFYLIQRILEPYRNNQRTIHQQLENPAKRLKQYKKKSIKIAIFGDNREEVKPPRVLYPVPPKYQPKEEEHEEKPVEPGQEGAPLPPVQGQPPPPQGQPVQNKEQNQPNEGQQEMGGFGEQPEQPDDDQPPEQVPDKLKPKHPIYSEAISQDTEKKYKQGYQFYLGNDSKQQRRMQLRYIRRYHDSLRKQKEDAMQIDIAHEWAKKKSTITKDMQKRLEEMKLKPSHVLSKQPPPIEEKIALQDELKFGFTTLARNKPKTSNQFDLSYSQLPPINQTFDQKSIRRDRLNSLKHKFGKLLNLGEQQERESAPSLCQYSARRRGLSEIIRNHSQSKERLFQLQQISEIKDKLTKVKININIKALSKGLVLPQNEQYFAATERQYPGKDLPSNPNLVETKKKKKKKK